MPITHPALLTVLTLPAAIFVGAGVVAVDGSLLSPLPPATATATGAVSTTAFPVVSSASPPETTLIHPLEAPGDDIAVALLTGETPVQRLASPDPTGASETIEASETTETSVAEAAAESSFVGVPQGEPLPELGTAECVEGDEVDALADVFGTGLITGADYQRAFPLPTGRVLWLFQDAFLPTTRGPELVHNVGLVQSGSCFQLLRTGSGDRPAPYMFADLTDRYDRWFWPLGGEIGTDGRLHVFVAEMVEHGGGYLRHTEPIATWLVTIDPGTFAVVGRRPAPDDSTSLHGWSVVSHGEYSYLYGHCYRQFGWGNAPFTDGPPKVHDWSCTADVTVARVARGRFDETPQYWDGTSWSDDPVSAVAVFPTDGRAVNATQVAVLDGRFVAATKVGDWWGDQVLLDVATSPEGPWTTYDTVTVEPMCADCNTYFASIVPFAEDEETFAISISNNTWGGHDMAHYRPTVVRVAIPTV